MDTSYNTERPKEVKIATYMLLGGLLVTFVCNNYEFFSTNTLYGLIINGYLYAGIYKGRKSARVLAVLLFALGLYFQLTLLRDLEPKVIVFVTFAHILIQLVAFYLLFFSPGKKWFSRTLPSQSEGT